jgi:predicted RNase H-like nuclease (RuvC/YqgF family)
VERRKAARREPATAFDTVDLVSEEATGSNFENGNVENNSATEEAAYVEKDSTEMLVDTNNNISLLKLRVDQLNETNEKLSENIKMYDDTLEQLNDKLMKLAKENLVLKDKVLVTTMFYDTFRDEMKDKFGYDSEKNWQEILKKEQLEKEKFSCINCVFASKFEPGL